MKQRCHNPNDTAYKNYGGRGIAVCERWRHSFKNFFKDMGKRPTPKHSIERKNNNGNYEPGNCKWATMKEQHRNTRKNHLITFQNKTQCLSAWSEELSINWHTLRERLTTSDWPVSKALSAPVKKNRNHILTFRGKTQGLLAWSKEMGIKYTTLASRLSRSGWSVEKAFLTPVKSYAASK